MVILNRFWMEETELSIWLNKFSPLVDGKPVESFVLLNYRML